MSLYGNSGGDTAFRRKFIPTEKSQESSKGTTTNLGSHQASNTLQPSINYQTKPLVQARTERIDFAKNLNKTQIVQSVKDAGFACEFCNQTFKDSASYLDHINSKRHLINAGLSLRIEKSSVEQVKQRIVYWKKKLENGESEDYDLQARVEKALKQEQDAIERRREKDRQRKRDKREKEVAEQAQFEDEDVAALMGFGGFKSKN